MEPTISASFAELAANSEGIIDTQMASFFEPDERITYEVRWPRGADDAAPGLFIYVSPKAGAKMPEPWGEALDRHNLAWIGAQDSGNEVHVARRVGMAMLACAAAAKAGVVNESRAYLSGFSGGGRVASMMMPTFPSRFAGAMFICGANPMLMVMEGVVEQLGSCPMIFLTGTGDFNLEDTRMAHATFCAAGLMQSQLVVVDGLGHALPDAEAFEQALAGLDGV